MACGSGQGCGILSAVAKSFEAGDYSERILGIARRHYGERVRLQQFDAQRLPFADGSKDVILLFEALYYIPDARQFVSECRRVLRSGGAVLIVTANKDLSDFNPSPHSHRYYGAPELRALFEEQGFASELFGFLEVGSVSLRQKLLRPVKAAAVRLGLVPKTMAGKDLLRRIVFGKLTPMPAELPVSSAPLAEPKALRADAPDRLHKVLYCHATLRT